MQTSYHRHDDQYVPRLVIIYTAYSHPATKPITQDVSTATPTNLAATAYMQLIAHSPLGNELQNSGEVRPANQHEPQGDNFIPRPSHHGR